MVVTAVETRRSGGFHRASILWNGFLAGVKRGSGFFLFWIFWNAVFYPQRPVLVLPSFVPSVSVTQWKERSDNTLQSQGRKIVTVMKTDQNTRRFPIEMQVFKGNPAVWLPASPKWIVCFWNGIHIRISLGFYSWWRQILVPSVF